MIANQARIEIGESVVRTYQLAIRKYMTHSRKDELQEARLVVTWKLYC